MPASRVKMSLPLGLAPEGRSERVASGGATDLIGRE